MLEGRVVARGLSLGSSHDAVWERIDGRWVESDVLDPQVVFAWERTPAFLGPSAADSRSPGGRWAVVGSVIVREQ